MRKQGDKTKETDNVKTNYDLQKSESQKFLGMKEHEEKETLRTLDVVEDTNKLMR